MNRRLLLTLAVPLVLAAVFARLGFWQLARRNERLALNATLISRADSAPQPLLDLTTDTAQGHYRRVTAAGVYDYAHELVYAGRTRNGSPGVDVLTPLRVAGRDTLVLVNRGWVYSPDARAVQYSRWRERDSASVAGYAETFVGRPGQPAASDSGRMVRALNRSTVERIAGRPVAPYVLIQTSDSVLHADSVPVRREVPVLDAGPHGSYAIQWFGFAIIAIVGGGLLVREQRAARERVAGQGRPG